MNNSGTHNNVLANFQPMPKRFMIWDDLHKRWFKGRPTMDAQRIGVHAFDFFGETMVFGAVFHDPHDDGVWKGVGLVEMLNHLVCVQTTGLYDKNGQEIFEGSVIKDDSYIAEGKPLVAVVIQHSKIAAFTLSRDGTTCSNLVLSRVNGYEVIGHILSNPELLEEK